MLVILILVGSWWAYDMVYLNCFQFVTIIKSKVKSIIGYPASIRLFDITLRSFPRNVLLRSLFLLKRMRSLTFCFPISHVRYIYGFHMSKEASPKTRNIVAVKWRHFLLYKLKQKTYRLKKRDLLTQTHKRRQIKLLNLGSMHFYKCHSHIL